MIKLLEGLKVLDLTTVVLGPFLTQIMGDLGAEVIKVESLNGDIYRGVYPGKNKNMGAGFLNCNRNKKSISIDLKTTEGLEILKKLILKSDVFVHNMRMASIENLGLSYSIVSEINPSIIYCSATGFGSGGKYKDKPAYDDIIQSMSGMADLLKDEKGTPQMVPTIMTDKISGLYTLYGILSALYYRNISGKGVEIEVPMYESMVSFLLTEHLQGHIYDPPLGEPGYQRILNKHRKPHKTSDGYITIMPYSYQNWIGLFELLNRKEMAGTAWLKDATERSRRSAELYKIIGESTPEKSTAYWMAELEQRDIPCARVHSLDEIMHDVHLEEVSFFQERNHPTEGKLRLPAQPLKINGEPSTEHRPAPNLGADTLEIMRDLGFGETEIDAFIRKAIIRVHNPE